VEDKGTKLRQLGPRLPASAANQPGPTDVGSNEGKLDLLETRIETYNLLLGSPRRSRRKNRRHRQPPDRPRRDRPPAGKGPR